MKRGLFVLLVYAGLILAPLAHADSCIDDIYQYYTSSIPRDDFYENIPIEESTQAPPVYTNPLDTNLTYWAADEINYFTQWNCTSPAGIGYVRRLGIAPLGSHDASFWKDSTMLSYDEMSGGFPVIYFTQTELNASVYATRYVLMKAYYNIDYGKWFITTELENNHSSIGISSQDGKKDDYVMNEYVEDAGSWFPGWGPAAILPGNESKIPGVSDTTVGFSSGHRLYGSGPLGLTTIINSTPLDPDHTPYPHYYGSCIHMNPTLFDYNSSGSPQAFSVFLFAGGDPATDSCYYPNGSLMPTGNYVYRYNASSGWQLDQNSSQWLISVDTNKWMQTNNWGHYSTDKFIAGQWTLPVMLLDLGNRSTTILLNCSDSQVGIGEASGSEDYFIFVASGFPYSGSAFNLSENVPPHDIYIATKLDISPFNTSGGRNVSIMPEVIDAYRDIFGRDPNYLEGFGWSNYLRYGIVTEESMRNSMAYLEASQVLVTSLYQGILGTTPNISTLNVRSSQLANGSSLENITLELAEEICYKVTTSTTSTTTTTLAQCGLVGDHPPCGVVTLEEVLGLINEWTQGAAGLSQVIDLINAWATQ